MLSSILSLHNPTLGLRDSNGALLVFNNNWQDNPAQIVEINAAGLAPASPLEAAIAATLPPGLYTVLLAGVDNNDTGLGLVEVYEPRVAVARLRLYLPLRLKLQKTAQIVSAGRWQSRVCHFARLRGRAGIQEAGGAVRHRFARRSARTSRTPF